PGFHAVVVKNYTYFLYASVSGYCGNGGVLAGFANTAVCTATPLAANTWTHLAVTYVGTTLSLFRNGVLVASRAASGAAPSSTGTLQIGASQFGEYFQGLIDEVSIYDRALSPSDVLALSSPAVSVPVASITVTPAAAGIAVARTAQLTATLLGANGVPLLGRSMTWASSSPAVATVSAAGVVTGLSVGSATVTATTE